MKTLVEFIGGFLGAGKTSFLNSYLEVTHLEDEIIVVVQCEFGKTKVKKKNDNIVFKEVNGGGIPSPSFLKKIINFYKPNRMIIECNGVSRPENLLEVFQNDRFLCMNTKVGAYFTVIDGPTFHNIIKNLAPIILPQICVANMLILNRWDQVAEIEKSENISVIKSNNTNAYIFKLSSLDGFSTFLNKNSLISKGFWRRAIFILKGDR